MLVDMPPVEGDQGIHRVGIGIIKGCRSLESGALPGGYTALPEICRGEAQDQLERFLIIALEIGAHLLPGPVTPGVDPCLVGNGETVRAVDLILKSGMLTLQDELDLAPEFVIPGDKMPDDILDGPVSEDVGAAQGLSVEAVDGSQQTDFGLGQALQVQALAGGERVGYGIHCSSNPCEIIKWSVMYPV